jgi:hypothetical protein
LEAVAPRRQAGVHHDDRCFSDDRPAGSEFHGRAGAQPALIDRAASR